MNLRPKREPQVNLDDLARSIAPTLGPEGYAPPALRQEAVVKQVESFGALPTKEIDDIIAAAEGEIAELKREAQSIRDAYMKHTTRITEDIRRLMKGVELSMETMKSLRTQCEGLRPEAAE